MADIFNVLGDIIDIVDSGNDDPIAKALLNNKKYYKIAISIGIILMILNLILCLFTITVAVTPENVINKNSIDYFTYEIYGKRYRGSVHNSLSIYPSKIIYVHALAPSLCSTINHNFFCIIIGLFFLMGFIFFITGLVNRKKWLAEYGEYIEKTKQDTDEFVKRLKPDKLNKNQVLNQNHLESLKLKRCPYCDAVISDGEEKCEQCGADL